jgi:hypothetical protein
LTGCGAARSWLAVEPNRRIANEANALLFPACGQPLPDHQLRIVDDHGRELPERQEGRLEFQGPSATAGYYRNPEATQRLFPHGDDWLDSGDRAYLANGDVYLTGRVKDLIIRGGRNIYPYELEQAVGEIPGIRKGCVAVFASADLATGSEHLVVVAETRATQPEALAKLRQQIQSVGVDLLGTPPDQVVLVPPHTVLKTSSGKIRRAAIRELFERNALGRGGRALWLQLTRIALASGWAQTQRFWRGALERLYAAYAWTLFGLLAPAVWLGIMTLPKLKWRWALRPDRNLAAGSAHRHAVDSARARTLASRSLRTGGQPLQLLGCLRADGNHPTPFSLRRQAGVAG